MPGVVLLWEPMERTIIARHFTVPLLLRSDIELATAECAKNSRHAQNTQQLVYRVLAASILLTASLGGK